MEVLEAVKTRRSARSFDQRPLSQEVLETIETAIINSPLGSNSQESHFVIVQNEGQIRRIKRFAQGLSGNPVAVVVLCSNQAEALNRGGKDTAEVLHFVNFGIGSGYILLAAHSSGVGTCPVRSFHRGAIQKILGLPQDVEPELLISLGYTNQPPRPKTSKVPREVISYEQYGTYKG